MPGSDWAYQARPNVKSQPPTRQPQVLDINPDYTLDHLNILLEDDDAIKGQLRNLLSTPIGSEPFEPTFGSNLPYRLFDPITAVTGFLMETDTILAITKWMASKVRLINPSITPLPDQDGYIVVLPYVRLTDNSVRVSTFEIRR